MRKEARRLQSHKDIAVLSESAEDYMKSSIPVDDTFCHKYARFIDDSYDDNGCSVSNARVTPLSTTGVVFIPSYAATCQRMNTM